MTLKYRLLLAVLLTLIALGYQVALAQTKTAKKDFIIPNEAACNCNVVITPAITNPTVCNLTNGSVALSITGGLGALTFQWKDPSGKVISTSKDLTNVGVGYYFLEIKDANAPYCGTYYSNHTLSSSLNVTTTIKDNVGCVTANGAITPTVTGGSGNYGYTWRFPDGTEVNTKNISGVKAGSYYLMVTDMNLGCVLSRSLVVKSNTELSVTANSITENTSCASPTGGISVSVTNGSGQYSHAWYDMQINKVVSNNKDINGVLGGEYNAFVTDRISGCIGYEYFTVGDQTVPPDFTVSEVTANTNCKAPFNGGAKLELFGTGPYEVTWSDGLKTISTERDPRDLPAGRYGFEVTDKTTKCKTSISVYDPLAVEILDESLPNIHLETNELTASTNCAAPNGKIKVTISDPTTPYSYSWSGQNSFSSTQEDLSGLEPGLYQLTIQAECNNPPIVKSQTISSLNSRATLELDTIISDPENNLDPNSIQVTDPPQSLAKATISDDKTLSIDYSGTGFSGTDKIRIRACDLLGACTDNLITIEVEASDKVVVYNAVAPNSNGDNKFMRIANLPENNRVFIFNRWGDVVFSVDHYDDRNPDRRFEGIASSGKSLPSGTYMYKIEVDGKNKPVTGYLSLKQ